MKVAIGLAAILLLTACGGGGSPTMRVPLSGEVCTVNSDPDGACPVEDITPRWSARIM